MISILKNLFQRSLSQTVSSNLKNFEWEQLSWMALSLNSNTFQGEIENQQLTLSAADQNVFYRLCQKSFHFGKSPGLEYKGGPTPEAIKLAHELMEAGFVWMSRAPVELLKKSEPQGISEADEQKAYEWLRVSSVVINKALDDLISNPPTGPNDERLFQAQVFAGTKHGPFEWRLLLFQLDIHLIFQDDGGLMCTVYNDQPEKRSVTPALKALFYRQRGPVFDLVIELINKISLLSKTYQDKWQVS